MTNGDITPAATDTTENTHELELLDDYEICGNITSQTEAFNESRTPNKRYDNTDRPNYFVCFKVIPYICIPL